MRGKAITCKLDKKIFPYDKLVGMLEMTTSEKNVISRMMAQRYFTVPSDNEKKNNYHMASRLRIY